MFINIIHFPPIQPDKDAAFREWFAWSNEQYAKHQGFISRKLLKSRQGGNYVGIVEHESYETFMAMHTSPTQAEANQRVKPLFDGSPTPDFLEVEME
jgi:antibiotic biosynthesis monooxygenase (ABM) superfamily enzyme